MKITQPLLAAALSKCAHITKSSHGLPILSTVRMEARSGRLSLWATDLNQFSIQHVDCDGELEPACVGVGRLQSVIAGQSELTIVKDKSRLFIKGGSSKSELAFLDAEEFAPVPSEEFTDIGVNCTDLAEALGKVSWAAGKRAANDGTICENVHFALSAKRMMVEGFNGVKMAKVSRPAICADADFLVHCSMADALEKSLEMPDAVIALSSKRVRVTGKSGVDYYKLSEGPYYDTDKLMAMMKAEPIGKAEMDGEFLTARVKVGADNLLVALRAFGSDSPAVSVVPKQQVRLQHGDLEVLIAMLRDG